MSFSTSNFSNIISNVNSSGNNGYVANNTVSTENSATSYVNKSTEANTVNTTNAVSAPVVSNNLSATALIGAGKFVPRTMLGWIILFILVTLIIIITREIYADYRDDKSRHAVNADNIDNLPV